MHLPKLFALTGTGALVIAAASSPLSALAVPVNPLDGTIDVVHASDASWVTQAYECTDNGANLTPRQSMVAGPQRAPFGSGSHKFVIGQSTVQTELYRTPMYDGTPLSDITRLAYSTYAQPKTSTDPDRQPPYLRINVDSDTTDLSAGRDASLFFFPANNADQQNVADGTWQHWDVAGGNINVDGDTGPANATTLAAYATAHPNAALVNNNGGEANGGAIATIVGCAQGGDTDTFRRGLYYTDRVIVGDAGHDTLFDFESDTTVARAGMATKVVNSDHLRGWVHQAYDDVTDLTSNQRFVRGPATPPVGAGSLRFHIGDDASRVELFRAPRYDDRLLRDLRGLKYSTFERAGSQGTLPQQPAYMRLSLDNNGDGERDESLFFIPANNPAQGDVLQATWQDWNAFGGRWSIGGDNGAADTVTLKNYLVAHPDATIVNNNGGQPNGGGLAVIVGASGDNQRNGFFNVDDVVVRQVDAATSTTVSGIRFDLEPSAG